MKERSKNPTTKMVAKERIGVLFLQAQEAFRSTRNGATGTLRSPAGLPCASGSG